LLIIDHLREKIGILFVIKLPALEGGLHVVPWLLKNGINFGVYIYLTL